MISQAEFEFLFYSARKPPLEEEPERFLRFLDQTFGPEGRRMHASAYERYAGKRATQRRRRKRTSERQLQLL